jgi:hypothetical protein
MIFKVTATTNVGYILHWCYIKLVVFILYMLCVNIKVEIKEEHLEQQLCQCLKLVSISAQYLVCFRAPVYKYSA